jgi:hypothetical protein
VNYPAGFTQGEHDRTFGGARGNDYPNREDCFLCSRSIEQDPESRHWFLEEDVDLYGIENLGFSQSVDAFETQEGWVCSADCWNDNCAVNEDESIPKPFLVRRSA